MKDTYTDTGIYTYSDLTKLLGISRARIKGLVDGHKYKDRPSGSAVIDKKSFIFEDKEYFTFLDLIELKFIQHFMKHGVKRNTIIKSYHYAKEELKKEHPFATKFTSDQINIFMDNNKVLVNSIGGQISLRELSEQVLLDGIDFKDDIAARWTPYKDIPEVILDPHYRYGMPVLKDYNVKTETLYDAFVAEKENVDNVSEWFNMPSELIVKAVEFERRLAA